MSAKFAFDLDPDDDFRPGSSILLESTKSLLAINRGERDPDRKDALHFKRLYSPAKLMAERVALDADKSIRTSMRRINMQRSLRSVVANQFGGLTIGLVVGHQLSIPLEEMNPLHIVEQNRRVTQMGPGGIGSEDSVTEEASNVDPSQFGFLSAWEGPESGLAGVDQRLSTGTTVGSDGKIYQLFEERATGKTKWLNSEDLIGKNISVNY